MKRRKPPKNTKAEDCYVEDMERDPALARLERGVGKLLHPSEYPEPLKRLIARERSMVRIKLSAASRRKLEALSKAKGVASEKLAQRWFEQGLAREAG
jgi:hypothetical protein